MTHPTPAAIRAVRRFNRDYTRRLGLLESGYLHTPFTLTEGRVLFELAHRDEPTAGELALELGLDRGLLSRLLARLVRGGWVARTRDPDDRRRAPLRLTAKGKRAFAELDRRAERQTQELLSSLPAPGRDALIQAARVVAAADAALPRGEVILRDPRPGDYGWIIHRHGVLYAQEYGWDATMEGFIGEIIGKYAQRHDPAKEKFWVAERDGEILGSVYVVENAPGVAQLRCLLVEPTARGLGIGRRLVRECVTFARQAGYATMILWTNDVLVSARKIYEAEGFVLKEEERHHSFGKDLVGQTWELTL